MSKHRENTIKFHKAVEKNMKNINIEPKFKILKFIDYEPGVIFVGSLFRLQSPYNDDIIYTKGLEQILKTFPKHFANLCIRIYVDDSILGKDSRWQKFYANLNSYKCVELIHYSFPQFKFNKIFHDNLFGAMIRMIPLFKFTSIKETIVVIDVDYQDQFPSIIDFINAGTGLIADDDIPIIFNSYQIETYMDKPRLMLKYIVDKYDFLPRFVAQPIIARKKMDPEPLLKFMECMFVKCRTYMDWVDELNGVLKCEEEKEKSSKQKNVCASVFQLTKSKYGIFMFGIDEFFINVYVLEHLLMNKTSFCIRFNFPAMANYHYFMIKYLFKYRQISPEFLIKMYKYVLQEVATQNIYKNYRTLDKIIFIEDGENGGPACKPPDSDNIKYSKRLYIFLKENIKNGSLYKSIHVDRDKMVLYKKYFALLETIDFDEFGIQDAYYLIKYKPNNAYNFHRVL